MSSPKISVDGSPQQVKAKQGVSARNRRTNGTKAVSKSKVTTNPAATPQSLQPVPDLWLEAKKTAEENSRIFAGKQIHPFFSSWKVGKKDLEGIEVVNNGCLGKQKERNVELAPVHVFENDKDNFELIDWCNWTFDDEVFGKTTCNEEIKISSFEGTITSLKFDGTLSGSKFVTPIIIDEELTANDPFQNMEKDLEVSKVCTHDTAGYVSSQLVEQINAAPLESVMSYYLNRGNYSENSLWTNKYHPEKASQVCGNMEAVKFIKDWLQLWHSMDFRSRKSSYSDDKHLIKDQEYGSCDSDSDAEYEEVAGLKNVLLVTGPVGSGKSAAIYACAEEQGFQVIEGHKKVLLHVVWNHRCRIWKRYQIIPKVNASDWRNGALLKQKFGEAVGSHCMKRSQESPSKHNFRSSPVSTNGVVVQYLNNSLVEVISLLEEGDDVSDVKTQNRNSSGLSCDKGDIKTLILFEDVDVTLCDDRGFISTIQQLADTGKRPMILTSNNENPPLPDNLDREKVCFTMPSVKELAYHIYLICSAEKANIQPDLIERCVKFCRGDIRKTLMHLQFWCQNKQSTKEGKLQNGSCPLMFDLKAGYRILPKLIPWELPSSLSEFIEAEVAKSLSRLDGSHCLLGVIEEEEVGNINVDDTLKLGIGEKASIEAKKEEILSRNCSLQVDYDIIAFNNTCEFSNTSGSPVAFTRRNKRRKSDTVLSDSEDETCNHDNLAVSGNLSCDYSDALIPAVHPQFPVIQSALQGSSHEHGAQLLHSEAMKVESAVHQSSETAHVNHINFFAADNISNQFTSPFLLCAEQKHQHSEFGHGIGSTYGPTMNHQSRHQLADQPFHGGGENGEEIETANATNLCLNLVQQCGEAKTTVQRILFPHPEHADPIDSPRNQSTGQLIKRMKTSMTEPQKCLDAIGDVSFGGVGAADASLNPLFDQLLSCSRTKVEKSRQQSGETGNLNPLCYTALGDFLNPSNGQLFHFVEPKEKEILRQHALEDDINHNNSAAVDGPLLQLSDQFCGIVNPEKSQQQHPEIANVKQDDNLTLTSEQLNSQEEKTERIKNQLPDMAIVDLIGCPVANNYLNPVDGKVQQIIQTRAEEHQSQNSDSTNVNLVIDQCQSVDMSYVPESTFVPETELNDGTDCRSGTDLIEFVSPISVDHFEPSILGNEVYKPCGVDLNLTARDEEMGDSQSERDQLELSTSRCPVMDECSRMDFSKTFNSFNNSSLGVKNPVQEKWNELRQTDLSQYTISENKNALQLLELSYRMSNLVSEGEILRQDREFIINDLTGQETGLSEETYICGCHDRQVHMAFSIAEYGYFSFAKDIYALQLNMGKLNLGWEMLVSTSNSLALEKLLSLNKSQNSSSDSVTTIKQEAITVDTSFTRERETCLQNIVELVVPLKCYLTTRGNALVDYLSSLAHISRSETSRVAEASAKSKRRVRIVKNYLSSSALDLSQDDILTLNEYNSFGRDSSKSMHEAPNSR
ncbi:uncharacterized protein LOC130809815 isoform X3 [Amaranthus tricolor]|uniref:uncharacterized protein LOC130809815 isoform X3 n=1 Tax=Amaranthus tricolor TaxID=29722 RepID=UPI002591225D|nr:uncharacterized protein LOC130809815 isoform X3 [Amaranthus tricolor]